MTLGFSLHISDAPTFFPEKILFGLNLPIDRYVSNYIQSSYYSRVGADVAKKRPKLHTIREDKPNRWRAGRDIHFVINNQTKNRLQFAPVVKCTGVQEIQIRNVFNDRDCVMVDGIILPPCAIEELAINDGFETVADFWNYFSWDDFQGKIIHWTEKRY